MIRALTEPEQLKILEMNYIGNLSYIYKNRPFIAPITYFFNRQNNEIIGYSAEGQKVKAMRMHPSVCLIVTDMDSVDSWKSVLAHGVFHELSGSAAKAKLHEFSLGIKDLIIKKEHKKLDFISQFSSKISSNDFPIVFTIKIDHITGKMRSNQDSE